MSAAPSVSGSAASNSGSQSQQARSQALRINVAQYIPASTLAYAAAVTAFPDAAPSTSTSERRRSAAMNPGGLETLPEASHVNALNTATGRSPLGLPHDIDVAAEQALRSMPPAQRALTTARGDGYDSIIVELSNQNWHERWERLCLASLPDDGGVGNASTGSASGTSAPPMNGHMAHEAGKSSGLAPPSWGSVPGGMGASWEIISAAGGAGVPGIVRSSSRPGLANVGEIKVNVSRDGLPNVTKEMYREAEEWRRAPAFRRGEVNMTRLDDTSGMIALASQWLDLDNPDEGVRLDAELALHQEIAYAAHLGLSHVVVPPPSSAPEHRPYLKDYARAINGLVSTRGDESASAGQWMTLCVRLPISSAHSLNEILRRQKQRTPGSPAMQALAVNVSSLRADDDWAWETWEIIRSMCAYNPRIQIVLDLSFPLPGTLSLGRWSAEPVAGIWLPAQSFLANAKGYPVLSKAAQGFVRLLARRRPFVALAGTQSPPPNHSQVRTQPAAYLQYIRYLEGSMPAEGVVNTFAKGYADWLQAPLQPLMDNLENSTYEVFERDPAKYALYGEAVEKALADFPASVAVHIWVCGAGRGPLVSECIAAAGRASRAIRITALEKNPNALVTLQERQAKEWGDVVTVRFGDMRLYPVPPMQERADIVVSELLGSFGDNELSPECLDGAVRFLKPDGVSIPASYSAFLTPLSSAKLHAEISSKGAQNANEAIKAAETPYVVLFQAVQHLAAKGGRGHWEKIQECWAFAHGPLDDVFAKGPDDMPLTNCHNIRTASHTFHIPNAGVCHGFAGYFEAVLYGDVMLSTYPEGGRGSQDMLSWFPIFFPLREPVYLPAGSELEVNMWRLTTMRKVWYEWCAEAFLPLDSRGSGPTTIGGSAAAGATTGASGQNPRRFSIASDGASSIASGTTGAGSAFQNAPGTPSLPDSAISDGEDGPRRIKIGFSGLCNPGGRSSWIGL
ncbi:unnamed protein product [Tilletia controversa]|uniref:Protein arginine N-methyltransferase n=1 Tax=Tilletia controversa TaxID=13291 RepID=A0A8X7T026_9BASI|nr:hypothetical protein A4X06_0g1152 [Tilletia controversa]CAD6907247.1 unnamed protein product [Tilletia controversa]CAD6943800.1 unnamed protein product [Tilletia controversa]CAD6984549.1 unnamed protein product [Tilletia controversa]